MGNLFKIGKSFTVRHKILEALYNEWNTNNHQDIVVGSIKIANTTNLPIGDIHNWHGLLVEKGEITCSENEGQLKMAINLNGRNAYLENRYINEGKKEKWDKIYDWSRIILPVIAIALTIFAMVLNYQLTSRVNKLETLSQPKK